MTVVGNVQRRNNLCLERVFIEMDLIPVCTDEAKLKRYRDRLQQIESEIELTYGES